MIAIDHDMDILQELPIEVNDHFIDSPEAVLLLADDETIRSIMNDRPAKLVLLRTKIGNEPRVVWLLVKDYKTKYSEKFYLDSYTGEKLEIK